MIRAELFKAVHKVEHGLGVRGLSLRPPAFWFDGQMVMTSDEVTMYKFQCPFPVVGGIDAELLSGVLQFSSAKNVEIVSQDKEVLVLKLGRTTVKVNLDSIDNKPQLENVFGQVRVLPVDSTFMQNLKKAALSIGKNAGHPGRLGITFAVERGELVFYSSDNYSLTRVVHKLSDCELEEGFATIVPPAFLKAVFRVASDECLEFSFSENMVEAVFESGLVIRSKVLPNANPDQFRCVIDGFTNSFDKQVEMPVNLHKCLERTKAVSSNATVLGSITTLRVENLDLFITTKGIAGSIDDHVILQQAHDNIQVDLPPDKLAEAAVFCDKLVITDKAVVVTGMDFLSLLATVNVV